MCLNHYFAFAQTFQGNRDQLSVQTHPINPAIYCRYVRIIPRGWRAHISMRLELYGSPWSKYLKKRSLHVFVIFGLFVWELNHIHRTRCNYHIHSVYIVLASVRKIYVKFSMTSRFNLNQFDYSLSISVRDSWLGLPLINSSTIRWSWWKYRNLIRGKFYLAYEKLNSKIKCHKTVN